MFRMWRVTAAAVLSVGMLGCGVPADPPDGGTAGGSGGGTAGGSGGGTAGGTGGELEAAQVAMEDLRALDRALQQRVKQPLTELREVGVLEKVSRLRIKRSLTGWWWWMDRLAVDVPLLSRRRSPPRFQFAEPAGS